MPELPEVELVARSLDRLVRGRRILAAELRRPGLAPDSTPEEFAGALRDRHIEGATRRGKHILISLEGALVLLVHLRMTGRFLLLPEERELPKHTHAVFHLEDGRRLAFDDQRHFGLMKLAGAANLQQTKELRSLAPEPFSEEFTDEYLHSALARSRRTLKETLLGNIYAAEVLFLARANPLSSAAAFSRRRVSRLRRAIVEVLAESIEHGSTMNVDPENIDGSYYGGAYEGRWRVYGREGEPCPRCRARVRRVVQAGRSTYFCPRCQRH